MAIRRQICERAVFDGSADDPRVLVHWYQQRMRAQLLASVAAEAAEPVVEAQPWWSTCLSSLTNAVTTAMRSLVPARAAQPAPVPAAALASMHQFPARPSRTARPSTRAIAA